MAARRIAVGLTPMETRREVVLHAATRTERITIGRGARPWRRACTYYAGAELPTLTLPPGRPVEELDHMLESLSPRSDR